MKKISSRYESNFRYMYFEFWLSLICVIKYLSKTWHTHDFRNQVLCLLYASLSKEAQFTKLPLSFHSWSFFKIKSLASCWKETTIYRERADFNKVNIENTDITICQSICHGITFTYINGITITAQFSLLF